MAAERQYRKRRRTSSATTQAPEEWSVFKRQPGLVLGFHGCDRSVAERVLDGSVRHLSPSRNEYDWLGSGIYFWEADPWRAWDFAKECVERRHLTQGRIDTPYVVGAVIDLGHCFNLLEIEALRELQRAHQLYVGLSKLGNTQLAKNTGADMGSRKLDRAVVEMLHAFRQAAKLPKYDTVRAAFMEGGELYEGAGFHSKNHIQIAVRETACIKAYFRLPGLR